MRVLHPVTQREKLVASGTYRYSRGGDVLKGEEHFTIHELQDSSWFVRIDYDWRALDGTSQLIEALLDPLSSGGRFQRIVAQLYSPSGMTKETFDFHPDHVLLGISEADGARRDIQLPMKPGYQTVLLKSTLLGIAASRWPANNGSPIETFGGYRTDLDRSLVFVGSLTSIGTEDIALNGEVVSTRVVELSGEFTQTLWLAESGIAIKRLSGELAADLHNYSHRAESSE